MRMFRGCVSSGSWIALGLLAAGGCGGKAIQEAVPSIKVPEIPFLKPDQPPNVSFRREVVLMPGEQTTVLVVVDRNGNEGPIAVTVKGLPAGVTATVEPTIDGEAAAARVTIRLAADGTLGDAPVDALVGVDVSVKDRLIEKVMKLQVPQVARVELPPQPPFLIQPGTKIEWHVPIERHGFEGKIEFLAKPSAAQLGVQVATVPAGESVARLGLAIAPDAVDGQVGCVLEWTSYGRARSVELPVMIVRRPFSLPVVVPVTLRRGETCKRSLAIDRGGYAGPIALTIGPLPEGTRASPPGMTIESDRADVAFVADGSAREGVAMVPVAASAGHLLARGLITVRVVGDTARESLPSDVVAALPDPTRQAAVDARRSPEARRALAEFFGVSADCGRSVRQALGWLASQQGEDGAWRSSAGGHDVVALSALAALPFLAEGITPETAPAPVMEEFTKVVERARRFLEANQPTKGSKTGAIGGNIESHCFGLIALSEAFALTGDATLKTRAKLAVDRLMAFQGKTGEWETAQGKAAADTAWAIVALQTARACGVGVPSIAIRRAANFLESRQTVDLPPGSRSDATADRAADAHIAAACLLAMEYAGRPLDSPWIVEGGNALARAAPANGDTTTSCSPLFLLFAGEALRTIEGEGYDGWNAAVRSFLTSNQVKEGEQAGSWAPANFAGEDDRVWATACATLCLQSHFRSLPLSRK